MDGCPHSELLKPLQFHSDRTAAQGGVVGSKTQPLRALIGVLCAQVFDNFSYMFCMVPVLYCIYYSLR
jgi:hypothetical protein